MRRIGYNDVAVVTVGHLLVATVHSRRWKRIVVKHLFDAAPIQVGCLEMLRFENTANGVPNSPEQRSTTTPEGFNTLDAMSSHQLLRDGERYPAVPLSHGTNDLVLPIHSLPPFGHRSSVN